jgi:hypothetical protein
LLNLPFLSARASSLIHGDIAYDSYGLLENPLQESTENQLVVGECALNDEGFFLHHHLDLVD